MRILLHSYAYAPQIGGIETSSRLLAEGWVRAGHEVVVVTATRADADEVSPVRVVRAPDFSTLRQWTRWSDMIFQNNISLHLARALPLANRPFVVTTQTWLDHGGGWLGQVKRAALRLARRIYISEAVAAHVGLAGVVIGNPYDDEIFQAPPTGTRERDLVVVGRLVSDKGVDLLVEALAILRGDGLQPSLTIVGQGPEEEPLRRQIAAARLNAQVSFAGSLRGSALADCLARHRVLAVPSRWPEPLGIVALEGIACGCLVVGSQEGGLPEAIGPCGLTFPNHQASALAATLRRALTDPAPAEQARAQAPAHLARFRPAAVAEAYLRVFEEALR